MTRRKDIPCACGETAAKNKSIKKINNVAGNPNGDFEIVAGNGLSINQSGDSQVTIGGRPVTQYDDGLMTSEDKIKLENVQNTYATKEEVGNVQLSVNDKVSKRGDTMTGNLTIMKSWIPIVTLRVTSASLTEPASSARDLGYTFEDSRGYQIGSMYERIAANGDLYLSLQTKSDKSGSALNSAITIYNNADGSRYVTGPSWSLGNNDDSDKLMTIKMGNRLPSLVHTVGNETIAGNKTFITPPIINIPIDAGSGGNGIFKQISFADNSSATRGGIRTEIGNVQTVVSMRAYDMNGANPKAIEIICTSTGEGYAKAPATPSNATSNEIATAGWVKNLINQFAAANGLNGI